MKTHASYEDLPLNGPDPIFIVGAPRSGTSLLRVMLNRHPGIRICDETHFFYYVYERRKSFGDLGDSESRRRLVDRYLSFHWIRRIGFDHDSLADVLMREGDRYDSFFLAMLRFYATEREKRRYGEKTPHHALYAELLCNWFPGCKLIHIVRDPRDVVSSLLQMPWASKSVTANARNWVKYVRGADRVAHLSNNYLLVQYERIVSEPETELRRICTFIGEEYSSEMIAPGDSPEAKVVSNEWWFRRANQQVTKARTGRWRRELSSKQIALTEWVVGPYLQQFGYVPSGETASVSTKIVALIDEVHQRLTKARHLWYYWVRRTEIDKEQAIIDAN